MKEILSARLKFAILAGVIPVYLLLSGPLVQSAEAQCLKVSMSRGKAKLTSSPPSFNGKCPPGSVSVGASTGAVGAPGAQGPQGPQGPQGAQGPTGPAGARGASAFDAIPSGTTVYGIIGMTDFKGATDVAYLYASLPALSPAPISASNVIIRANEALLVNCSGMLCLSPRQQAAQSACQGTSSNPKAAPGFVCIYPTSTSGDFEDGSLEGYDLYTDTSAATRAGFAIQYGVRINAISHFEGIWAYTAP